MSTAVSSTTDPSAHSGSDRPGSPGAPGRAPRGMLWILAGGTGVGFVVALVALARPRWFPLLDLAQTEMRLRDVWSTNPPLIGLPGRIGNWANQGSHPGPLSFWALAPLYRLFGSSAWAMQAATASLNLIAITLALALARRRGGRTVLLGVGAAISVLVYFFGASVLTQAWNPYLPILWFLVVIMGVWGVLCDDIAVLPVTAFAACMCLQTHISYLGLVGGLAAGALAWIGWSLWRRPGALGPRPWRSIAIAGSVVVLLWIPPLVQELTNEPGNLTLIWRHFTNPPEDPIGLRAGARLLLIHLNPARLLIPRDGTTGSVVPGLVFGAVWGVGALLAWRRHLRTVVALNVVILALVGLGVVSLGNIFGYQWYYLMLWAWMVGALMLVATAWVGVAVLGDRTTDRARVIVGARVIAALVAGGYLVGFAADARSVEPPSPRISAVAGELAQATIRAIESDSVPGGGIDGRYQVTITDTGSINAPGYTLVSEFERVGIDAGFPDNAAFRAIARGHRTVAPAAATAVVHYAVGRAAIEAWRNEPGVVEVAVVDPRTRAEKATARRLRASIIAGLRRAGLPELAAEVDTNLFTATFQPETPPVLQREMLRLLEIGAPAAVFVGPPTLAQ